MRNTGKRIITTSLAAVMIIMALLGNGIEARAADYSIKNSLLDYEFKVGDVIIPDENSPYCFLNFYDVNDPGIIITIGIDVTERYTIRESYSDGKNTVRTNAKWKCVKQGPTFLTLEGEPYIPQTEEKKPESTPPKEVEAQPIVADQPGIAE